MGSHTPGPWRVRYEEDEGHVIEMGTALARSGRSEVQHTLNYEHGLYADEDSPGQRRQFMEAEANARLIVAAPEMRSMLMRLVSTASGKPLCACDDGPPGTCSYCEARALLAKIEAP